MNEDGIGWGSRPESRLKSGGEGGRQDGDSAEGLSEHTQRRLGIHLRAMYDTLVQQPVPDRFRDLIAKLESPDAADDPDL